MTREEYERLPWTAVSSSNLARVAFVQTGVVAEGYHPGDGTSQPFEQHAVGTLYVEFHRGAAYSYDEVPESLHAELLEAESVGGLFSHAVRNEFTGTTVLVT